MVTALVALASCDTTTVTVETCLPPSDGSEATRVRSFDAAGAFLDEVEVPAWHTTTNIELPPGGTVEVVVSSRSDGGSPSSQGHSMSTVRIVGVEPGDVLDLRRRDPMPTGCRVREMSVEVVDSQASWTDPIADRVDARIITSGFGSSTPPLYSQDLIRIDGSTMTTAPIGPTYESAVPPILLVDCDEQGYDEIREAIVRTVGRGCER